MAEKCDICGKEIFESDIRTCDNCGVRFHSYCIAQTTFCYNCGMPSLQYRSASKEEQARQTAAARRLEEEQARKKAAEEEEKYQARINYLKTLGKDGYYEYKVISLVDKKGAVDTERLMAQLNDLGLDGWRLQCAYTNEMGKNALEIAGFGINATADQNILILERFVKFE